jgi:hypothetical protein
VIVWHLLSNPGARYADLGPDHHARHSDASRKIRGHIRQLEAPGLDVTETPARTPPDQPRTANRIPTPPGPKTSTRRGTIPPCPRTVVTPDG